MISKIEPKILKGTRDFLPEEMAKRNFVQQKIVDVFKLFGYDEIDTPAIEYTETLLGKYGDEGNKLIYSFEDNGGRNISLRYDQTVPFARVVATNFNELPMPFKRYQISKVWRADKPAKGRYREFTQCDIDIIGTKSLIAEAEIAKIVYVVLKKLGFNDVLIKINSRRLINSILSSLSIQKEDYSFVIRTLDKVDKIGIENVRTELLEKLEQKACDTLLNIMTIQGTNKEKLEALKQYETQEIQDFFSMCEQYNLKESYLSFEPMLARGLDYYTGIIYEIYIPDADIGAVCAGGRYDNLCDMFTEKDLSGVGVAFGFDRIVLAMEQTGLLTNITLNSNVLVTIFNQDMMAQSLAILDELQKSGISSEIYFEPAKMEKQFKFANKKKIPFVIVCGPDEAQEQVATIKNMETGKQKTIPINQINTYFNGYTGK